MRQSRLMGIVLAVVVLVTLIVGGCAKPGSTGPLPSSIKVASGSEGSQTYLYAVAAADVIQKALGITTAVTPTAGSDATMEALGMGTPDVAVVSSMHAKVGLVGAKGYTGYPQYEKTGPIPVRILVLGTPGPMGIIVRGNINQLSDLKGKKIYGNNLGSGGNLMQTQAILGVAGLTTKDVTILDMPDMGTGAKWLGEGKADAVVGGLTGSYIRELDAKVGKDARALSIPVDAKSMAVYNKIYPGLGAYTSPADSPCMPKGTTTFAVFMFLASRAGVSEDLGYAVTKAVLEHGPELLAIQKDLSNWNMNTTVSTTPPVPFHPGAIKYLKEKGVWTAELDQTQKDLLRVESDARGGK